MKLLIVEDEQDIRNAIKRGLIKKGYAVDTAEDGADALELNFINDYDLIVLDLNLPGIDGLDVLRKIRQQNKTKRILILSARSDVSDRIAGLDFGANDYLTKPFHFDELEARIRSLLRRDFVQKDAIVRCCDICLDTVSRDVLECGAKISLTKTEFSILEYLMLHQERPVSAEELIEHIYDSETDMFSNAISVHIHSLRKKLSRNIIKNIRGIGYQITDDQV